MVFVLQFIDLRLAVLGNVDAGKSTILGVLTQGELDNGRGRARLNLFRHLHEIQSGRTSSISHEILGFNSKGEVCRNSYKNVIRTKSGVFLTIKIYIKLYPCNKSFLSFGTFCVSK